MMSERDCTDMVVPVSDELADLLRRFHANEPPFKTDHDRLVELREQLHRNRVAGGKAKAAARKAEQERFWQGWRETYQRLVDHGKAREAISIIENLMIKAQAIPPGSDKVASKATIRRKLTRK